MHKLFQAVQLDTRDGTSWSILGNAYLAHFFSVSQNPRTLKQAMSAYKQAVSVAGLQAVMARKKPKMVQPVLMFYHLIQ